ncbi:hypothetical protein WJ968_06930 [Achromobacter xylosoxidans]
MVALGPADRDQPDPAAVLRAVSAGRAVRQQRHRPGRRLYAAGLSRAAGRLAVPGGLRQHADPGPGRHRLHRAGGRALRLHGGALRLPAEEPGGHPARAHHRDSGDHRRPVLAAAAGQQRPADQPAGRRRHLPAFVLWLDRHGLLDDAGVLHLHLPGRAGRVARLRRTAGGSRPEPGHAASDHQAARAGAGAAAGTCWSTRWWCSRWWWAISRWPCCWAAACRCCRS